MDERNQQRKDERQQKKMQKEAEKNIAESTGAGGTGISKDDMANNLEQEERTKQGDDEQAFTGGRANKKRRSKKKKGTNAAENTNADDGADGKEDAYIANDLLIAETLQSTYAKEQAAFDGNGEDE